MNPLVKLSLLTRRQAALWIFAAALAVRLFYIAGWSNGPAEIVNDAAEYHTYTVNYLDRGEYENSAGYKGLRMPGYPVMLGTLYTVFGRHVTPVQITQAVFGAATCSLIYLTACEIMWAQLALLAGFLSIFYMQLVSPTARILTESMTTFFITLTLWLWHSRKPDWKSAAMTGISCALAYLFRPEMILYAGIFGLLLAWRQRRDIRGAVMSAVIFFIIFAAAALPWIWRNYRTFGRPIATTTASNFNFYGWGIPKTVNERMGGIPNFFTLPGTAGEMEQFDKYRLAARDFFRTAPISTVIKAAAINLAILYYPFSPVYDWTYGWLVPLWLAGMILIWKKEEYWPHVILIGYLTAVYCTAGVMIPRHREIYSASLILLAMLAAKACFERFGPKFGRILAWWGTANIALWIFSPYARQAALAVRDSLLR